MATIPALGAEGIITNPVEVVKDLESKIEKALNAGADKATKADFEELNKQIKTLRSTITMREGDDAADKAIKKYNNGHVVWTKAMSEKAHTLFFDSIENGEGWKRFGRTSEVSRKGYMDRAGGKEGRFGKLLEKATNVNEVDSTSGEYMLRTEVDSLIHMLIPIYGVARRNCRIMSGVKGSVNLNALNAYPSFAFTASGQTPRDDGTVTPNSPTYTHVTVQPEQVSGIVLVTEKLIFDSVPGVVENATEALSISAALLEDQVLFIGDGTITYGGFTGLKTASIGYPAGGTGVVNVRNGSFTTLDPLLIAQTTVYPSIARGGGCKYHMHPYTFAVLQTFKSVAGTGQYFYDQASSSWVISGIPIEFNQVLDTPTVPGGTTFSIGAVPVIFGNMERAVTMVIGRDMQMRTLLELYAATNSIGIRLTYDYDYGIILPSALTRLVITS